MTDTWTEIEKWFGVRFDAPLLPTQIGHRECISYPERDMLVAIMLDVAHTLANFSRANTYRRRREYAEDREWVREGNIGRITFCDACHYLGLDIDAARRALLHGDNGARRDAVTLARAASCMRESIRPTRIEVTT
jgi:hypothetical protein